MPLNSKINLLSTRFASKETETAYQQFEFKRNLRANVWGSCLGILSIFVFIFTEHLDSAVPEKTIIIRLSATIISFGLLLLLMHKRLLSHQDSITTIIITILALALNGIISLQPSLDNTYYIGLIQGFIMFSLILRLDFPGMFFSLTVALASFIFVAFSKPDVSARHLAVYKRVFCLSHLYRWNLYNAAISEI